MSETKDQADGTPPAGGWSKVDLHLHTTASDGSLSPAALVALARQRGLRYIAVTDHDSTEGVDEALRAARGTSLQVLSGVELNTDVPAGELHVLGYYLDHHDPALQARLSRLRASRLGRGEGMVRRLRDLGLDVSWDRVREIAGASQGGAVGRPHVARALLEKGYVQSVREAFERYIGNDGPAYVPREKLEPVEAVAIILGAGGLPALAHPFELPDSDTLLPALVGAGLVGLECYYGTYPPEVVEGLVRQARALGLVPTGGSDFHGQDILPQFVLGGTPVPLEVVAELQARRALPDSPRRGPGAP
jgi:predicted metal-dependent phosphoesterase TrpH